MPKRRNNISVIISDEAYDDLCYLYDTFGMAKGHTASQAIKAYAGWLRKNNQLPPEDIYATIPRKIIKRRA